MTPRLFPFAALLMLPLPAGAASLDVRAFGAAGDGRAKDTAAIQRAIDEAARLGGATVSLGPGRYISGTLFLRSGIRLCLDAGAVLLMSPDDEDFAPYESPPPLLSSRLTKYAFSTRGLARSAALPPTEDDSETTYMRYALLLGEDVSGVTIEGPGLIDGNRTRRGGPKPIALKNSRNITIRDVSIANAPNYAISLLAADFVTIDNIRIVNAFADGIDLDNSHYVRISNSYIDSWDDAICPKASLALGRRRSTEHLAVVNCTLRTACSAFKFGTESAGSLRHVTVSNLTILPREPAARPPIAGIALESVDGADIEAVVISGVVMRDVRTPIFLRLGARGRGMDQPRPGSIRNVVVKGVVATGATLASSITAVPGAMIRGVTLDDIHISSIPAPASPSIDVPEDPARYPEASMFGDLPASGLYLRRAASVRLSNLTLRTPEAALRPAVVIDDARDIAFSSFLASPPAASHALILARGVSGLLLNGTLLEEGTRSLLRLTGANSGIVLSGSDWSRLQTPVDVDSSSLSSRATIDGVSVPLPRDRSTRRMPAAAALPSARHIAVIAHRGEHLNHTENTLPAYRAAIEAGADYFEVDVQTTSDGQLVLMHDATVDRTTNGKGRISEMTFEQIRALRAGGELVPTFEEALETARGKAQVYVDAKSVKPADLIAALERRRMLGQVVVYGGFAFLKEVQALRPGVRIMPESVSVEVVRRLIQELQPKVIAFSARDWQDEIIALARGSGADIFVDCLGAADQAASWQDAIDRGATGIQTDHPAQLVQYLRSKRLHK